MIYQPNSEMQAAFLACDADGAIYGGRANVGKTVALVMDSCYGKDVSHYTGIIFRRETTSITTGGGLWDTGERIYKTDNIRAALTKSKLRIRFRNGGWIRMAHLEYEKDIYSHQGGQYAFIGFDQLEEFTKKQFTFMQTRNRAAWGYNGRVYWRATCNPVARHWLRDFLDWWIDPVTGFAIEERAGAIRYYTIIDDDFVWVDKDWRDEKGRPPKSVGFFPGKENPDGDPNYDSTLQAQDNVTRGRLLEGNWNIVESGGMFKRDWFKIVDSLPPGIRLTRYYDMAATEAKEGKDPDFTGSGLGGMHGGELWIADIDEWREAPAVTERKIVKQAEIDGPDVAIGIEEEKGSAGKFVTDHYQRTVLKGYEVHPDPVSGQKTDRAAPWSALAEQGHVKLLRGPWNQTFIAKCVGFPKGKRDVVDAVSGIYKRSVGESRVWPQYGSAFVKELSIPWGKLPPNDVLVLVHLVMTKDHAIWGNCFLWGRQSEKLWVYAEFVHRNAIPADVVVDIRRRCQVSFENRNVGDIYVDRMYADAEFFKDGNNVARLLKKAGGRVTENSLYNEAGAHMIVNKLFNATTIGEDKKPVTHIAVDVACVETDTQYRTWSIKNGRPEDGYPFCRNLCGVVSVLRERGELREAPKATLPTYTAKTGGAKEATSLFRESPTVSKKREYDYLIR